MEHRATVAIFVHKSRVSHRTAPAGPLTCLHVRTSKIFFIHASLCFVCHLPIQAPSVQVWVAMKERSSSTSGQYAPKNKESEVDPFLPAAAAAICLLNFIIFLREQSHCSDFHALAGTSPILNNFLILPSSSSSFWKALFFLMSENLILHFFLLAISLAPNLSILVRKSTPSVSTLSANICPSS